MAQEVRQPIDQASLERYLNKHVPEIKTPLGLKQFGFGQSNPTYLLTDAADNKFVLRKKPPGKLLSKTAHRVDREYKILHALEKTDVPVPRAIILCEDDDVVGTPFYIMEFLDGRMVQNPAFPDVSAEDRKEMWKDAVRTLGKLHRVNPKDVGLENFGRPSGFYNRQIKTFTSLAESQGAAADKETGEKVGKLPHFDGFVDFYSKNQPKDRGVLFHGDYKIDNLVYHKTEPRVIGILDWEMATIGHPLGDLSNLIQPWTISNTTDSWPRVLADEAFLDPNAPGSKAKDYPGLPSRDDVVRLYEETAGFKIPERELTWASAFALFRDSIIFQGIAARYATRQATSEQAQLYASNRGPFAEMSWKKVQEAKKKEGSSSKL